MYPDLFTIGPLRLGTYGLLLMIGALVGIWMASRRAPFYGLNGGKIYDALFWCLFPGIIGARVVYIALNWPDFAGRWERIFSLQFQGLTSFGGMFGGLLGLIIWSRREKMSLWSVFDTFGVPYLVGHAFGRIGCLLNGCCHGRSTDEWFGVSVGHGVQGRFMPAQIMDTVGVLVAALIIVLIERRFRLRSGQSFGLIVAGYAASRFVYEFARSGTREDVRSGLASSAFLWPPFTLAHVFSAALLAAAMALAFWRRGGPPARTEAPGKVDSAVRE
jgi:phosphatidylglycerol:prolipoprotein diacylglycerol transferase